MANPGDQASAPASLEAFNAAPAPDAEREMLACCASTTFAATMAGGRPYHDADALRAAVGAAFAKLSWDDILESLSGHPRIGDRTTGVSAAEQSGAASATDQVRQALAEGNRAYEERFDHVFLICASGRSGQEMLDQLRARLGNDPEAEQAVVREELRKITQLRLTKLLSP
ncbi:MAG: 2-oxo-4-hydroxy-4-carboxy-5-ureidoimidazoline decarboxylase [Streptosporangiaceae bacterium]